MSVRARLGRGARWIRLLGRPEPDAGLRVSYGLAEVPGDGEPATGGTAKLQKLSGLFPHEPDDFTLLYLGSSALPPDLPILLRLARRRGAPVVVNQDGVGYPAWAGERWEQVNRPLAAALHAADHVLYQSRFCKDDADAYLGRPTGTWEVLPNAVDVTRFTPADAPPEGGPVLLLAGHQRSPGRLDLALRTFALVRDAHPDARLLVTGKVETADAGRLAGMGGVEALGRYAQRDAPELYRRAHVLLHSKVLDPCPNVVLEALASGLPVVHPASGGTVELVGDAGVAVPHEVSHEHLSLPSPEAMAAAVLEALESRSLLGERARRRAAELFPLGTWLDRHALLFEELRARARRPPA